MEGTSSARIQMKPWTSLTMSLRPTSKAWDEPNPRETDRHRPPVNQRGGIYSLSEDMELKAKISTLAKRVDELEGKRLHDV